MARVVDEDAKSPAERRYVLVAALGDLVDGEPFARRQVGYGDALDELARLNGIGPILKRRLYLDCEAVLRPVPDLVAPTIPWPLCRYA
jgi:hypothetical protein